MSTDPGIGGRCSICMTAVGPSDESTTCSACHTLYHRDCWTENHGCAVYGCSEVPPTEGLRAVEMASSYWGQEDKSCPQCGTTIRAAAIRCRSCGATFEAARPEDRQSFGRRQDLARRAPGIRQTAILLFVLALIPCTAPFAGFIALFWTSAKQDELKVLPPIQLALARLASIIGIGQTIFALVAVSLYAILHRG
jgi:hypothetical protein